MSAGAWPWSKKNSYKKKSTKWKKTNQNKGLYKPKGNFSLFKESCGLGGCNISFNTNKERGAGKPGILKFKANKKKINKNINEVVNKRGGTWDKGVYTPYEKPRPSYEKESNATSIKYNSIDYKLKEVDNKRYERLLNRANKKSGDRIEAVDGQILKYRKDGTVKKKFFNPNKVPNEVMRNKNPRFL